MSKTEELFQAIRERDLEALDALLRDDAAQRHLLKDRTGRRGVLHRAAEAAWIDGVARLLEAGAPVDARDASERTPLHHAATDGRRPSCAWLWRDPPELPEPTSNDRLVAFPKDPETGAAIVRILHRRGLVERPTMPTEPWSRPALELAFTFHRATRTDEARARLLRELEAEIDLERRAPVLRAQLARAWSFTEVCRLLLEHGADVDATDCDGLTPLAVAVGAGSLELVQCFLDHGADPDTEDPWRETPLQKAAEAGLLEIVRALLDAEALPIDALQPAAMGGHNEIVRTLVEAGVDLDEKSDVREAPLLAAARYGQTETIELLLSLGASPEARSLDGETPLHLFVAARAPVEIIDRLVEIYGPNPLDAHDRTPLYAAAEAVNRRAVERLLSLGADATLEARGKSSPLHAFFEDLDAFDIADAARLLESLIRAGADPAKANLRGETPRELGGGLPDPIPAVLA